MSFVQHERDFSPEGDAIFGHAPMIMMELAPLYLINLRIQTIGFTWPPNGASILVR